MSLAVKIKNVSKSYPNAEALKSITLDIGPNELFGFIGPDGAGKTTLFRILTSLILPDKGTGSIGNFDIVKDYRKIRKEVGYMPGRFSLYGDLTVEENLQFYARLFNTSIKENYDLIEDVYKQIEPFKKRRAADLSGGMKQKLALSCALIHKPQLIILDEPTTGVDAISRKEFWALLKSMQQKGITILVSTPYMDEAALCDRVALMQEGNILTIDRPGQIVQDFSGKILGIKTNQMHALLNDLLQMEQPERVYRFGAFVHLVTHDNPDACAKKVRSHLEAKGHQNIMIQEQPASIEDCFLALMHKPETP
ncbi:MAG: ABC transporter ATP-binding protein [Bacteroidales bacterium]|nr:ABC transporter ATP-binding protein [Bacteroidales bacterium]